MTRSRWVRVGTVVLLWLAAAAGATAVGMAAVGVIGNDIFGSSQEPLTQAEVEQRLASPEPSPDPPEPSEPSREPDPSPTATTASPSPSATPTGPATGDSRVIDTGAGTVVARCVGEGLVEVQSATPAQGYEVDADDDTDDNPSVKFEDDRTEIEVDLRCVGGTVEPEIHTETDDDDD